MIYKGKIYILKLFVGIHFGIFLAPSFSYGASIEVNPVRLQLMPGQKITSLEITNHSGAPVVLQLNAVKWSKTLGKDVHEKTNDVVITPPLIKLEVEEKQLVRLGIRTPPDAKKGATYRLIINEVPSPDLMPSLAINTLLEIRVPLVVAPLIPSTPKILWEVTRLGQKKLNVKLQNAGESYLSVRGISLQYVDGEKPFVEKPFVYYILPNQQQEQAFELPHSFKGCDVRITAQTDLGEVTEVVSIRTP